MSYQNYSGAWLTQTNGNYLWLPNPTYPVTALGGADTAKIWQSFTLPNGSPMNNLIVFGDGNYAAGNDQNNVLIAENARDLLYGGRGEDVLVGSGGSGTTFIIGLGEGNKVVQNFTGADTVRLINGPLTSFDAVKANMVQQGSDVILNDGGTMIAFRNASVGQFSAANFQLPIDYASLGAPLFREEFDNPGTIGTNWTTNYGYAGDGLNSFTLPKNGELQLYTSATFKGTAGSPIGLNPFSFDSGVMTIKAQPVSDWQSSQMWGYRYSSGMLESNYAQTYGYFEMRAEMPKGQGLWPAFWLLGPDNREIDVLEGLGSDTKVAYNAIHSNALPALGNPSFNPYADGFHTYGVMWSPKTITFYVDGTPVWNTATPYDQDQPLRMIVNLAVGGNWAGSPDGSTAWPGQMKIDYIRTYGLPGTTTPPVVVSPPPPAPAPAPTPATGDQVLTATSAGATLTGGNGNDTLNASQGADRLTGGAGADLFVFKAMPWNAGHITDFQVGTDKLSLSGLYTNGYGGSNPIADGYVTLVADGAGGTKVLLDTDGAGSANTIKFLVTTLDGVAPGALSDANLFGGSAQAPAPAPAPAPATGGQVLTSAGPGATLTGGSGDDTLNASQGADRLTGGAGADSFTFKAMPWSAGHITDFQSGVDKLNVAALYTNGYGGSNPIADGYVTLVSDGIGGTKVLLDTDGPGGANSIRFTVATLDGIAPGSLNDAKLFGGGTSGGGATAPATGSDPGKVLVSRWAGDVLVGGSGADTLTASQGSDRLTGGGGADNFDFNALPWNASHITDFQPGIDKLDLRDLAPAYTGGNIARDLTFVADGAGGTKVMLDMDGYGGQWPTQITTLDGVSPSSLTSSDWLFR